MAIPQVRLRRWRLTDAADVAVMIDDEHVRAWSAMGSDLDGWIQNEVAESRARLPSRVELDRSGTPRTLVVHVLPVRSQ